MFVVDKVFELQSIMLIVVFPILKVSTVIASLQQHVAIIRLCMHAYIMIFHVISAHLVNVVLDVRRHIRLVLRDSMTDVIKILQVLQRAVLNKLVLHCPDALVKQLVVAWTNLVEQLVVAQTNEIFQTLGGLL